jgi:hypothetical protein
MSAGKVNLIQWIASLLFGVMAVHLLAQLWILSGLRVEAAFA